MQPPLGLSLAYMLLLYAAASLALLCLCVCRLVCAQVEKVQPKACQPAYLEVVDIAGLVKGAAEVGGRGNGSSLGLWALWGW